MEEWILHPVTEIPLETDVFEDWLNRVKTVSDISFKFGEPVSALSQPGKWLLMF